jgi:hypothetical protein
MNDISTAAEQIAVGELTLVIDPQLKRHNPCCLSSFHICATNRRPLNSA